MSAGYFAASICARRLSKARVETLDFMRLFGMAGLLASAQNELSQIPYWRLLSDLIRRLEEMLV
ncbi:MAG TPA: hypothetical protein PLW81_01000 [Thiobacillaceae bacterium]|nr:hypothetical protein [Thiobacillaceae bacterium]